MSTKLKTTRGVKLSLWITGTVRFDLEDIVGDREVDADELERLKDEALDKVRAAVDGAELHNIVIDECPIILDTETT